ncbi:two component, sigma54 specific, transcriptional regulator, Fis family [Oleidesulfovibrio alaskensis G20]|jgi:two-component system NtrC family response regulator|uniref:Two component, sigma54 specific, transcriptional regulator, Fis family n=1 Tax=Oleidesulfovibrio alaskensis (strain ATCC BAA-1058 / DSM 17464 / G20) TaxID=207559 RepID=Q311B4_OLEA2|nr:sigma-54 dependent transcriptional regulator [Oleidesulfovibrio alaskensis]ABB38482.1 two component, sigma54 specific, transcriptional regulator, Fis family [Oleidesulfovibrio alaskensis G20]MBG0773505.1 sigma-54-dependent Fis family transcriptional regulator [Oleidesulfovibrio alaskensis]
MIKRLLVIDDEPGHRLMVRAVMEDNGWQVFEAASGEDGLSFLGTDSVHVVLLDMRMPGMDGKETLARILDINPQLPVVMLTAYGTVGSAVEAMKKGAFDYLSKPADNDELAAVLEKAWEYSLLLAENQNLRQKLGQGDPVQKIVGSSPAMLRVLDFIRQAGPSEATVLVMGESGTGKELIAEALHDASLRREKTLVKVNCAALPGNLLESELFGYVKGAFTGAVKDKPGRFQLARGGTLFLDEIGEMPVELQAKLLRALQERVIEPLGSVRPVDVDVRIVAATNRDLRKAIEQGDFREDLFFRLNVLEVVSPPLRERIDDIPLLVSRLVDKLSRKNRKEVRSVSPEFLDALMAYHWPGNVRELENVLERALILSRSDILGPESLPAQLLQVEERRDPLPQRMVSTALVPSFDDAERETLLKALEAHNGHREKTADALGISRRTLQYKLKKFGLTRRS